MGRIPRRQGDTSPLAPKIVMLDGLGAMIKALPPDASYVAREVYRRMRLLGFGQKALSLAAGNNETYVRDILRGTSLNPKSEQFARLAAVLGCSVADLLGNRPDPGVPSLTPQIGDTIESAEEASLVGLWRRLRPAGRKRLLAAIEASAPGPVGTKRRK